MLVTLYESHHTQDALEDSYLSKVVFARGFCSSVILYITGLDHSVQMLSPYFIGSLQARLSSETWFSFIFHNFMFMYIYVRVKL